MITDGQFSVVTATYFYNYPEIDVPMPPKTIPITVVVNLDDDLINPQEVLKRFQGAATIRAFETGGHRFKDKTPIVREVAAALQRSDLMDR